MTSEKAPPTGGTASPPISSPLRPAPVRQTVTSPRRQRAYRLGLLLGLVLCAWGLLVVASGDAKASSTSPPTSVQTASPTQAQPAARLPGPPPSYPHPAPSPEPAGAAAAAPQPPDSTEPSRSTPGSDPPPNLPAPESPAVRETNPQPAPRALTPRRAESPPPVGPRDRIAPSAVVPTPAPALPVIPDHRTTDVPPRLVSVAPLPVPDRTGTADSGRPAPGEASAIHPHPGTPSAAGGPLKLAPRHGLLAGDRVPPVADLVATTLAAMVEVAREQPRPALALLPSTVPAVLPSPAHIALLPRSSFVHAPSPAPGEVAAERLAVPSWTASSVTSPALTARVVTDTTLPLQAPDARTVEPPTLATPAFAVAGGSHRQEVGGATPTTAAPAPGAGEVKAAIPPSRGAMAADKSSKGPTTARYFVPARQWSPAPGAGWVASPPGPTAPTGVTAGSGASSGSGGGQQTLLVSAVLAVEWTWLLPLRHAQSRDDSRVGVVGRADEPDCSPD